MREGHFFCIPENPTDIETLWRQASRLERTNLPEWLTEDDAADYRYFTIASESEISAQDQRSYAEEMACLADRGFIFDQPDGQRNEARMFLRRPARSEIWSIGVYTGSTPFELDPATATHNPVLTRADITDAPAEFVADPFMIQVAGAWQMFFEMMNWRTSKGEIGLASSRDGFQWQYERVVLAEPFHLSYPYVFAWGDDFFLIPESHQAGGVRLYQATRFPYEWTFVADLFRGPYLADPSIFHDGERWWLFVDASSPTRHDQLRLFWAKDLLGPWREHPRSPIIDGDPHNARPAGRVVHFGDQIIRFAQNCVPNYGTDVRAFAITELSPTAYRETAISGPILGPGRSDWNAGGMHHIDAHRLPSGEWLACVDGWSLPSPLD